MGTIRRIYIFLVAAISLQVLAWGVISLLRDVVSLSAAAPVTTYALEIAILLVAVPFWLVHWLWAQRLAREAEERGNILRRIYLYGMLALFLFAFTAQTLDLLTALLRLSLNALGVSTSTFLRSPPAAKVIADALIGMIVLALAWLYHQWIILRDARALPETGSSATVHRLYVLSFSALGLAMMAVGAIQLLRWLLFQIGTPLMLGNNLSVADEIARLLVGFALWLPFWLQAQIRFSGASAEERESALRKFYLYLVVFAAVVGGVTSATFLLAEFLRQSFGLGSSVDFRNPFSILSVMLVLWVYHSMVLRGDIALALQMPRQAGVRRLYLYLIAGIGLAAFLGGLIGIGRVLLQALAGESWGTGLKEQLAWSTAALLAGLPVWLLSWRPLQHAAVAAAPAGRAERQSIVRKIYLYFYLFLASLTVLFSATYILFRLLSLALGDRQIDNLLSDLANAIGFGAIAVGVWIYHGMALRGDGTLAQREKMERLGTLSVVVVDGGEGHWGCATLHALKQALPGLNLQALGLTPTAATAMAATSAQSASLSQVSSAGVLVAPWSIAAANSAVPQEIMQAIASSPARKLIVPLPVEGWEWCGVERLNQAALAQQAVRAVKQILEGENAKPAHSPIITLALVIIGACVLLQILSMLLGLIPIFMRGSGGY